MSLEFDFGRNWQDFSAAKLDNQRLQAAVQSLQDLIGAKNIVGRSFLDIGCGSGLFAIAAAQSGAARVVGFDLNPTAIEVSTRNALRLKKQGDALAAPHLCVGNVLDQAFLAQLGTFDLVYAWGSLHHTGAMWQAIRNAASLVEPERGSLVMAIYNYHWSSPIWQQIKWLYNLSPGPGRWLLNYLFGAIIYAAKALVTGRNPLAKERGMDFWYDVIDWLGGYPYEYASPTDIVNFIEAEGFQIERIVAPTVPTGCNEFVFRRADSAQ
ncbi:MAG: class I SAM-dependent methyltransferase [Anaerolineae bacterium]|nr:class I SAM-dependent methyltransferase [Anaerolineae bacterium]